MFQLVRLAVAFLFGAAAAAAIEASPAGAFLMGAISVALTVWVIADITRYLQGVAS